MTVAGIRDPLVLLPGMNCTRRMWEPVVDRLRVGHPNLVVHHGSLARDSVDGCVADLLATLPERFALAGLSLGGIIAMALARTAPARVSRLCLMSTNPHAPTVGQRESWASHRRELAHGRGAREVQAELLPRLVHPPNRTRELDDLVLAMGAETGAEVLDRQLAAQATRIDERLYLRSVHVPTLVLAAEADALCGLERHEEMHRLVAGSRLEVLKGVGHLSTLEAPGRVARAMTVWLR